MVNERSKDKRSLIGQSTHCTSFGVCGQIQLRTFYPPPELEKALKNSLIEHSDDSQLCKNYIQLIKSLRNIKRMRAEYYPTLFKILLYIEDCELQVLASKHNLKSQDVRQVSNTFEITVPTLDEDDPYISIGDKVRFEGVNSKFKHVSTITDIIGKKVYVSISKEHVKSKLLNQKVDVYFQVLNWPLRCSHYALHIIFKHKLLNFVYPTIDTNPYIVPEVDLDWVHKSVAENPEQKTAIINILNKSACPAPYILFGPPGTGKTTTLVEAICQIRKQYRSNNILICASSNTAADEIAKRLLRVLPCKDVFRMYATSKHWSSIDDKISPCSNFIDDTVLYLPKEIFILKKIVITTLVTCIRLQNLKLRNDHFSHIFIDEASQSMELESLIPLAVMSSRNKTPGGRLPFQIVIAGDPYQLGPIVRCKKIDHLLGQSLLERLLECEPYQKVNNKYNPRYITKLLRNYRSHEAILHISNKLFYDNELLSCNKSSFSTVTSSWSVLSNRTFPIIFLAVKGEEIRTPSMSVYNTQEAAVVIECAKKLICAKIGTRKVLQQDIGIVTPFKQQKLLIEKTLSKHRLNKITVGTVETFQGQEREIMLLTTVRSQSFKNNGVEHIGFLSHPKRFNVALTRAKNLLIVIGNPSVLCKDRHWNALWQYCKENNANFENMI